MDHTAIDNGLAAGDCRFDASLAQAYGGTVLAHPAAARMAEVKTVSMLGIETLLMLRAYAMEARGAIVEVGPYVGGSTIAILHGVAASHHKTVVSIDCGGAYLEHPTMPSADIHADWLRNLDAAGFAGRAHLSKGFGNNRGTCTDAVAALEGRQIGMLFIDANGFVWQNMRYLVDHLADDCLLVLDDVTNLLEPDDPDQNIKFGQTRQSVADGLSAGAIEHYGTFLWGTWFGRGTPRLRSVFPGLLTAEEHRWT